MKALSIIAKSKKEEELKTHFAVPFIEKAKALDAYISVQSEAAVAVTSGVSAMHDVTEGGNFRSSVGNGRSIWRRTGNRLKEDTNSSGNSRGL